MKNMKKTPFVVILLNASDFKSHHSVMTVKEKYMVLPGLTCGPPASCVRGKKDCSLEVAPLFRRDDDEVFVRREKWGRMKDRGWKTPAGSAAKFFEEK